MSLRAPGTYCLANTSKNIWMKALFMLQALLLAGLSIPVYAKEPATQAPAVDLMAMNQDARCKQVLVTCLINGAPMRMMLDTGATHTVLHTESAARVPHARWIDTSMTKFRGNSAQRPKMLRGTLKAGPAESEMHLFMVMNLSAVRSMMAEPVDGILGMDMLQHLPFTFDLKAGEMYWGLPSGVELVPLYATPDSTGRVVVNARCGGKELKLLLDTGSSVTRVREEQWAPGAGAEIGAQIGDIDSRQGIRVMEGKPGDIELGPGVFAKAVSPILCKAGDGPSILGMDCLNGLILVHIPREGSPGGMFLLAR